MQQPPQQAAAVGRARVPGSMPGTFPKMHLARDEKILFETQPHILPFILGPIIGFVVILVFAAIWIAVIAMDEPDVGDYFVEMCLIPLVIFLIIAVVSVLFSYLRWKNTHYALTNKRAITTAGIFGKSVVDCAYDKIQNVTMTQGFLERIFGYGTVVFATAGTGGGGSAGTAWAGGFGWGGAGVAMGMGNVMFVAVREPITVRKFAQETIDAITARMKQDEYKQMAAAFKSAQTGPPGAPPAKGQKFCNKCGTPNPAEAGFCSSCGGKIA